MFFEQKLKKLVKIFFSSKSEAGIVLNLSLIFQQILAWYPYELGPCKKSVGNEIGVDKT